MPYIPKDKRKNFDMLMTHMSQNIPYNKGELNYIISSLLLKYVQFNGVNYQNLSDAIAACDDAKEEFRRRQMNPYEDTKIEINGDLDE